MKEDKLTIEKVKKFNESMSKTKPSDYKDHFWINYFNSEKLLNRTEIKKELIGKWCIFANDNVTNNLWKKLYKIVDNDSVLSIKARSGMPSFESLIGRKDRYSKKVICVYVENYKDTTNVFKVRDLLRDLGIKSILRFKTDQATKEKNYKGGFDEFLYIDKIEK